MSLFFVILAAGTSNQVTITVAEYDSDDGGPAPPSLWGYSVPIAFGSCSPASIRGYAIFYAYEDSGGDFEFCITNTGSELGASWFTSLIVGDDAGAVTLDSSDATHNFDDGLNTESWVWTNTYWTGDWTDQDGNDHNIKMVG